MSDFRVIVTGSRDWPYPSRVWGALNDVARRLGHGDTLTVRHGVCPTGADAYADTWAEERASWNESGHDSPRVVVDPHPADWRHCSRECNPAHRKWRKGPNGDETYCPTAGHRRNQEMVDAGADLVLAFHKDNSRGTADCVRRAEAAGLRVETVEA